MVSSKWQAAGRRRGGWGLSAPVGVCEAGGVSKALLSAPEIGQPAREVKASKGVAERGFA